MKITLIYHENTLNFEIISSFLYSQTLEKLNSSKGETI